MYLFARRCSLCRSLHQKWALQKFGAKRVCPWQRETAKAEERFEIVSGARRSPHRRFCIDFKTG